MPLLPSLLFFALLAAPSLAVAGCLKEPDFSNAFKTQLNSQKLDTLFKNGVFLGEGSFGKVHQIPWNGGSSAVKRVRKPRSYSEITLVETEIAFMKAMSGKKSVVDFYGCLENNEFLYLAQEKLYKDLESATVLLDLKGLSVNDRLAKYKRIAEIFGLLHQAGIIHEDIKPPNIMTTDEHLTDFRIIDMGLSSKTGKDVLGGSPIFNSPDKIGINIPKAAPSHDIYALGLTFAVLESKIEEIFKGLTNSCVTYSLTTTCHDTIMRNVEEALKKSGMDSLTNTIKKACAYSSLSRYRSMEELAADIGKLLGTDEAKAKKGFDEKQFADLLKSKQKLSKAKNSRQQVKAEKNYLKQDNFYKDNKILTKGLKPTYYNKNEKPTENETLDKNLKEDPMNRKNKTPTNQYANVPAKVDTNIGNKPEERNFKKKKEDMFLKVGEDPNNLRWKYLIV